MKTLLTLLGVLIFAVGAFGELGAILHKDGVLSWTNSVSNAVYRIDSASTYTGIYSSITNGLIQASNTHLSVQLEGLGSQPSAFYRVAWTDAPPAQPVGNWEYNGYSNGVLVVTGLISITSSVPVSGTCIFQSTAPGAHPVGSGTFTNGTVLSSNSVRIPLKGFALDNFGLSGQMALDEYWGTWFYNEVVFSTSGQSKVVHYSGRFSAKRVD